MGGLRVGLILVVCAVGSPSCSSVEDSRDGGVEVDAADGSQADASEGPDVDGGDLDGARPDARPGTDYDVGYVNDFTITPFDSEIGGFIVVVNTGSEPLDLSTAEVVTAGDNHDDIVWGLEIRTGSDALLETDRAAGYLSLPARTRVLANGVVTEQVLDENLNFVMTFQNLPNEAVSFQGVAVIAIGGVNATLPVDIEIDPGGDIGIIEFNSARRVSAMP